MKEIYFDREMLLIFLRSIYIEYLVVGRIVGIVEDDKNVVRYLYLIKKLFVKNVIYYI